MLIPVSPSSPPPLGTEGPPEDRPGARPKSRPDARPKARLDACSQTPKIRFSSFFSKIDKKYEFQLQRDNKTYIEMTPCNFLDLESWEESWEE